MGGAGCGIQGLASLGEYSSRKWVKTSYTLEKGWSLFQQIKDFIFKSDNQETGHVTQFNVYILKRFIITDLEICFKIGLGN